MFVFVFVFDAIEEKELKPPILVAAVVLLQDKGSAGTGLVVVAVVVEGRLLRMLLDCLIVELPICIRLIIAVVIIIGASVVRCSSAVVGNYSTQWPLGFAGPYCIQLCRNAMDRIILIIILCCYEVLLFLKSASES